MRWTKIPILVALICGTLIWQTGCGGDNDDENDGIANALVEQSVLNQELLTQQELYEFADWTTRWEKSREARKRYVKLRDTHANEALKAYIEYYNWMHYGHPLAEKIARISVQMDMAGETTIPDMLQLLHLKLEMVKDLTLTTKEHIAELEAEIRFWNELGEELVANGSKVTDCKIEYEISVETLE